MPIIANMKMNSISRTPREAIAGVAARRVVKISYSFYCFLIRRKTRPILSVRRMLPSISTPVKPAQAIDKMTIVQTTIVKSNRFQLS